jgi:hypothetical protein
MAVDLFSLRMNMEVTGANQAAAALRSVDAQGKQTAVTAAQAEAALVRMGLSGTALATSLQRMGFQSTAAAAAGVQLGGAMNAMTAGMASASGRVIHPMAMAMSTASTAALATAVSVRQADIRMREAARGAEAFKSVKAELAGVLSSGVFRFLAVAGAIDLTRRAYNAVTEASDRQVRSTLMLDGVSRIAGLNLGQMQQVVGRVRNEFRTSTADANELTASAARLTSKAGQTGQTFQFLSSWLNVAAAQGIGAKEALLALNITLRGQDEGLDRLFQKNPSVIWKEYADSIGKSVGELSQAEKWLSIMAATMDAGNKVGGAYVRWLETAEGKQASLNAKMEDFSAAVGRVFNPIRIFMADLAIPFLNWLGDVIDRMGRLKFQPELGITAGVGSLVSQVLAGGGKDFKGDPGGAVDRSVHPVLEGLGPVAPPKKLTAEEIAERKAAAEAAERERRERLLATFDNVSPVDQLAFQGFPTRIAQRTGRIGTGPLIAPDMNQGRRRGGGNAWDDFEAEQFRRADAVDHQFQMLGTNLAMTLGNAFAAGLGAVMQGKNPFKAFGNVVLAGLGGIMQQMGQALIAKGAIMLTLLPFLSNPLTAGPAMIAAGAALVALGGVLGGIATGPGGSSGGGGRGGLEDKTTRITLTSDGLGGRNAPHHDNEKFTILGVDSPKGQRVLATAMGGAKRRGMRG